MSYKLRELLLFTGLALLLFVVLNYFIGAVAVDGSSMYPTLQSGDLLVSLKTFDAHRGDVVIFEPLSGSTNNLVKRVIAVPGDKLKILNGEVWLDDQKLNEDYLSEKWTEETTWNTGQSAVMQEGKYFLMGDNRNHSDDSRNLGPQDRSRFLGKAMVKIWPLTEIGIITPDSQTQNP
jgi:signal peptidase I